MPQKCPKSLCGVWWVVGKPNLVKCFGPRLLLWTWTFDFGPGPSFSITYIMLFVQVCTRGGGRLNSTHSPDSGDSKNRKNKSEVHLEVRIYKGIIFLLSWASVWLRPPEPTLVPGVYFNIFITHLKHIPDISCLSTTHEETESICLWAKGT